MASEEEKRRVKTMLFEASGYKLTIYDIDKNPIQVMEFPSLKEAERMADSLAERDEFGLYWRKILVTVWSPDRMKDVDMYEQSVSLKEMKRLRAEEGIE